MVMKLKSRCSILFHFEVPGGKWATVISSPVSLANFASSTFQGDLAAARRTSTLRGP
jgi:hypothetical protein